MYHFTIFSIKVVTFKLPFKHLIVRFPICLLREIDSSSDLKAEILKSVLRSRANSEWEKKRKSYFTVICLLLLCKNDKIIKQLYKNIS